MMSLHKDRTTLHYFKNFASKEPRDTRGLVHSVPTPSFYIFSKGFSRSNGK